MDRNPGRCAVPLLLADALSGGGMHHNDRSSAGLAGPTGPIKSPTPSYAEPDGGRDRRLAHRNVESFAFAAPTDSRSARISR